MEYSQIIIIIGPLPNYFLFLSFSSLPLSTAMSATATRLRRVAAVASAAVAVTACGGAVLLPPSVSSNDRGVGPVVESMRRTISDPNAIVPSRSVQESTLIGASSTSPLDILVVGGGATGCGVALDATTRGLRVGLVEREDFSSGTSSRSTKLIHGGKHKWLICLFDIYFHCFNGNVSYN